MASLLTTLFGVFSCILIQRLFANVLLIGSRVLAFHWKDIKLPLMAKHYEAQDQKPKGKQAIHRVSAWIGEHNLVIGQQKAEEKSNEITAIPKLLEQLVIKDTAISIDAMGCQTAIAKQIIGQGGHYVFGLKGSQRTLHEQVADFFETAKAHDFYCVKYDDSQSVNGEYG